MVLNGKKIILNLIQRFTKKNEINSYEINKTNSIDSYVICMIKTILLT